MQIGDIVRLKSGGPKMTITQMDETTISCAWFDRNGRDQKNTFPAETVERFVARPPAPKKKDW